MVQGGGNAAYGSDHGRNFRGGVRMVSAGYVAALGNVRFVLFLLLRGQCGVYLPKRKNGKQENGGGVSPDETGGK